MASVAQHDLLSQILQSRFGLSQFRNMQLDAITATLQQRDSVVVMSTGGGKSLTYQLPPLVAETGFTVVVSPMLALAKEQVQPVTC
jgi:ATP-dependent DNA helicase RecQ